MLEILVPILYHLNDARSDQSRLGLMHIGVFILLLLSGERNFGKILQIYGENTSQTHRTDISLKLSSLQVFA